jgi:serine/threonine-protein kinase
MHLFAPLPDPRSFEPGLSDGICRVLRKMMAKERDERYPDVHTLDLDLYRLQSGGAPEAAEPSATAIAATYLQGTGLTGALPAATAFEAGALSGIEKNLAQAIGPMARVLVRQAARKAASLEELCRQLGDQVEPGEAREAFLSRCRALSGSSTPPAATRAGAPAGPAAGAPLPTVSGGPTSTRAGFGEADLMVVESELMRRIGPVAQVLVRQAARAGGSRTDLVARLEASISDEADRRAFRRAVLGVD